MTGLLGFDAWSLIEAAVILGLTIGVWNRNRGCAIALFAIWVIEKVFQGVSKPSSLTGLPMAVTMAAFFWEGISGTLAYHRVRPARSPGGPAGTRCHSHDRERKAPAREVEEPALR